MATEQRRQRLGELIQEERLARRWTWPQAAQATGVSLPTLRRIRAGAEADILTYARIEAGLRLQQGAIRDFLAGRVDHLQPAAAPTDQPPADAPLIFRNLWNHPDPKVREDIRTFWGMDKISPEGRAGLAVVYTEGLSEDTTAGLRRAGLCGASASG